MHIEAFSRNLNSKTSQTWLTRTPKNSSDEAAPLCCFIIPAVVVGTRCCWNDSLLLYWSFYIQFERFCLFLFFFFLLFPESHYCCSHYSHSYSSGINTVSSNLIRRESSLCFFHHAPDVDGNYTRTSKHNVTQLLDEDKVIYLQESVKRLFTKVFTKV